MKCKSVYIVINPVSGQEKAILKPLYLALQEAGVEWECWVSRSGEEMLAKIELAVKVGGWDAVAVYGGDGSIMAAAEVLAGRLPLIILPGGTGNVTAKELKVPLSPGEAMKFGLNPETEVLAIDMAKAGDKMFLQRLAMGIEADMVAGATRELKNKLGSKAYSAAMIKAIKNTPRVNYRITLDGEVYKEVGVLVRIDNSSSYGMGGLKLASDAVMWDGLLDVYVVQNKNEKAVQAMLASTINVPGLKQMLFHKKAKKIKIESSQPVQMAADGEIWGKTPVEVEVVPGYARIVGKKG
jgi:diacylglycerol kinase family enzyme